MLAFLLTVSLAVSSLSWAAPPHSVNPNDTIDIQLRSVLAASKKNLGPLQSWQSKIFDDEAVPQFQRFIKDYKATTSGGVDAQIDYETLRQYLKFYAPLALKQPSPVLVVVLFPQLDCLNCVNATESVRGLVRERLLRRGLTPEWVAPIDLGPGDPVDAAVRFAEVKKAAGSLVIRWGVSTDDVDAANEGETRYEIHSNLQIRNFAKHEGKLELLEATSFDHAVGKLMTDAFTDLGSKESLVSSAEPEGQREKGLEDALIDVQGAWNYAQYSKLRDALSSGLSSLGALDEREVAKGHAVFVLSTSLPIAAVSDKIASLRLDGFKLGAPTVDGRTLRFSAVGIGQ
jgi:hypothetical protein